MRAKTIQALKIYKFPDGTYEATRDGMLYTFFWNPYKINNLKKIGGVGPSWIPQGRLVSNPPTQMILQVQNGINALNESVLSIFENINNILKPKSEEEIQQSLWKGPGFYAIVMNFVNSVSIEFKSAKTPDDLYNFYETFRNQHQETETFDLIKIDTEHKMPLGIDFHINHAPEYYGKTSGAIDHILRLLQ